MGRRRLQIFAWIAGGFRSHLSSTDWHLLALVAAAVTYMAFLAQPVLDPIAARELQVLSATEHSQAIDLAAGAPAPLAPAVTAIPSDYLHGGAVLAAQVAAKFAGAETVRMHYPAIVLALALLGTLALWNFGRLAFGSVGYYDDGKKPSARGKSALASLFFVCSPGFVALSQGSISQAVAFLALVGCALVYIVQAPGRSLLLMAVMTLVLSTLTAVFGGAAGLLLVAPFVIFQYLLYMRATRGGSWLAMARGGGFAVISLSAPVIAYLLLLAWLSGGWEVLYTNLLLFADRTASISVLRPTHEWGFMPGQILALLMLGATGLVTLLGRLMPDGSRPPLGEIMMVLLIILCWALAAVLAPSSLSIAAATGLGGIFLVTIQAGFHTDRVGTLGLFGPVLVYGILLAGIVLVVFTLQGPLADHRQTVLGLAIAAGVIGIALPLARMLFRGGHSVAALLTALALMAATLAMTTGFFPDRARQAGSVPMAEALLPYRLLAQAGDGSDGSVRLYVHARFDTAILGYVGPKARIAWTDQALMAAEPEAYLVVPAAMAKFFPTRMKLAEVQGGATRQTFHLLGGQTQRMLEAQGFGKLVNCLEAKRGAPNAVLTDPAYCQALLPKP